MINKKGKNLNKGFSRYLGMQRCCVTGLRASRGAGQKNMHCHHIFRRKGGVQDDEMQVPLIGYAHVMNKNSYHQGSQDFIDYYREKYPERLAGIYTHEDLIEYFVSVAEKHLAEYYKKYGS